VVVHQSSQQILSIAIGCGGQHDISLARENIRNLLISKYCFADLAYFGLKEIGRRLFTPFKKPKGGMLEPMQKQINREVSRRRIVVEHVIGRLKRFRIVSERYRNRRRRYGLRMNLIAGILNWMAIKK
jgi:hypothetical protein